MSIKNSFCVLLALSGCATASSSQTAIPPGQCQVAVESPILLSYHCANGQKKVIAVPQKMASKLEAYVANKRVLFFESDRESVTEGLQLLDAVIEGGDGIRQPSGAPLPSEALGYVELAKFAFIAQDRGRIKLTFNMGSDAVTAYMTDSGGLVASYTIF